MASTTPLLQKRKRHSSFADSSAKQDEPAKKATSKASSDSPQEKGEYETGRVICEACGEGVSFRDVATGGFTVQHWEAHRLQCSNGLQQSPEPISPTEDAPIDRQPPPSKRRRAKRSEEERIDYLRSDPYVAKFEAYRVLCASCDKWIRLRPNSTYCSIPWDAHRKSCLAKRAAKSSKPVDDRTALFANDPNVRKFDSERVLCKLCETWIPLGASDNLQAVKTWMDHRAACQQVILTSERSSSPIATVPSIASVPPPSKHLLALASSSSLPAQTPSRVSSSSSTSTSAAPSGSRDLTPTSFSPNAEPRRKNAEQRAAQLRADPLVGNLEPNRAFCSLCRKWVQLRQDSTYCAYPWQQHRAKCLKRQEKRVQTEVDLADFREREGEAIDMRLRFSEATRHDSDEPESEEGVESGNEIGQGRRPVARREERPKAQALRNVSTLPSLTVYSSDRMTGTKSPVEHHPNGGMVRAGEDNGRPGQLADLETPLGRIDFAFHAVVHLFASTYERTDELTIAALVIYLNAAMPPDKHEDFDTAEVMKAAITLHERGCFVLEGDVIRVMD